MVTVRWDGGTTVAYGGGGGGRERSTSVNDTVTDLDFSPGLSGDSASESGGSGTRCAGMELESSGAIEPGGSDRRVSGAKESEGIKSAERVAPRDSTADEGADEEAWDSADSRARLSVNRALTADRI